MTLGELALFFKSSALDWAPEVVVSALDNWTPDRYFDQCSLPWVPPSPNMPTPETALLYTGMCLFEGTNLNEGRGTDTPFQVIGAPWLHADRVIGAIAPEETAGMRLEPVTYVPRSIPGKASSPRYQDTDCAGIRVTVTDRAIARPFTLAVALLSAIRRQHAWRFKWGRTFDMLAGSEELRKRIEDGETAAAIIASYTSSLTTFDASRPKLYAEEPVSVSNPRFSRAAPTRS
jgi:uncharacterized protein YbbC (DUF1343 family)